MDLGRNLTIPDGVLASHMAVLGKTRAGKSSALRLFVEGLLERGERVCVVDPKGDWWGLKSSADGKKPGYSVVIFGGPKGDLPINQHAGAKVAELIAGGNRPCVIDLGGWMVGERTRFFIDFASTLFRTVDAPLHLVVDEVHNFAPQGKVLDPDAGKMLHWTNRLGSEGAGKGLVIFSASQRPQKVHKDFLTCAETLIAMRVIHKLDRDAVKDWIDGAGEPALGKEVLGSLATMARGEGWVWSPEAQFGPQRVQFPLFGTFDSFAAPVAGKSKKSLSGWANVNIDAEKAKLASIEQEAKANDPKELRKRIAELEKRIKGKKADPKTIEAAEARGVVKGRAEAAAELKELRRTASERETRLAKIESLAHLNGEATKEASELVVIPDGGLTFTAGHAIRDGITKTDQAARRVQPQQAIRKSAPALARNPKKSSELGPLGSGGDRRMLVALAQHAEGMNVSKLSILSGIAARGGTFRTYLGKLKTLGFVEGDKSALRATEAGIEALGDFTPLPTGPDLVDYWYAQLGTSGARTMLQVLVDAYPNAMSKEQLGEESRIAVGGGTFRTYLGKLKTLGLVTGGSELTASDVLFD